MGHCTLIQISDIKYPATSTSVLIYKCRKCTDQLNQAPHESVLRVLSTSAPERLRTLGYFLTLQVFCP